MRIGLALAALLLVGCTETGAPPAADHGAAVAACAAAVAGHVGKGADEVVASWAGDTAGGGIVTVTDAAAGGTDRLHECEVDADGRVVALRHPGA